jgi:tungstate transport system permease protein
VRFIFQGLVDAGRLIVQLNPELIRIVGVSLKVSLAALFFAALAGVPLGLGLAVSRFPGKRAAVTVLNTLMGLPTVVVGLLGYSFLSRRGLLGDWRLLYTPYAMMIGQFVLVLPIVAALTLSAVSGVSRRAGRTALALGASPGQKNRLILGEARFAILAAVIAGFGRIFAEIGVSTMLGGNIQGYTRNIPTAIAYETGKGDFSLGLALGLILLALALGVNLLLQAVQGKME